MRIYSQLIEKLTVIVKDLLQLIMEN